MITKQGLKIAIEWQKQATASRREFITLPDDYAQITHIKNAGHRAFMRQLDSWQPARLERFEMPKDNGEVREVFYIPMFDRLALLAVLASNHFNFYRTFAPYAQNVDFAHPYPQNHEDKTWFTRYKDEHALFRAHTQRLQNERQNMLFTDISDFSGSCQINLLRRGLKRTRMRQEDIAFVCDTLEHWGKQDGLRGIPQGYCMSDILLKAYMLPIDFAMTQQNGISYYRYSDDIRLAAGNLRTLQRGHHVLLHNLNNHNLHIKEEKTSWHLPDTPDTKAKDSLRIEDYLQPCWDGVRLKDNDLHNAPHDVRALDYSALPDQLLRSIYATYIAPREGHAPICHPSLFNFTLHRMGKAGITDALAHTGALVAQMPQRLDAVLSYVDALNDKGFDIKGAAHDLEATVFDDKGIYANFGAIRYKVGAFLHAHNIVSKQTRLPATDAPFLRAAYGKLTHTVS